jgi:hypothetical protein
MILDTFILDSKTQYLGDYRSYTRVVPNFSCSENTSKDEFIFLCEEVFNSGIRSDSKKDGTFD